MASKIDILNRRIEELEDLIDLNAEGDPRYLADLMKARDQAELDLSVLIMNDF